jgi:hypothetical protein
MAMPDLEIADSSAWGGVEANCLIAILKALIFEYL